MGRQVPTLCSRAAACWLLLAPVLCTAETGFGSRHVERFTQESVPLSRTQVWDIATGDDDCRVYFATNDGLIVWDGVQWDRLRPQGSSVLRALRWDSATERLYSCGVNEFGYWKRDPYGGLAYTMLYRNSDFRSRSDDFWRIALESHSGRLYFQCQEKICIYDPATGAFRELFPQRSFQYLYEVDGAVYFQDGATLFRLEKDMERTPVCEVKSRVVNLMKGSDGKLLAAVEHVGLLTVDRRGAVPLDAATNALLADAKIICARRYDDRLLLVGTTRRGLFLVDDAGAVDRSIPFGRELDNLTILSVAADHDGNIWLGLDAGAAVIDNSSRDRYFADTRLGAVHCVLGGETASC